MDWWNELTDWTSSDNGWRVLSGVIIPFVAIVVAGVIAALIGRGATKRVVSLHERESRCAAVAAVVSAARKAARWGSLGHDERAYADHLAEDADLRLRMLPVSGAPLAADWAQHEIADIKKNSSTFTSQAGQSLGELQDRMLEWQARPNRARKLFKSDLERWKFDSPDPDAELIARQQDWNADQVDRRDGTADRGSDGRGARTASAQQDRPAPTTTSLRPTAQPGGAASPVTPAAAPASSAAVREGSVPSWSRGAASGDQRSSEGRSSDQDETTPIGDDSGNATRAYGDGATTPLSGAPVRPPLGSPLASRSRGTDDDESRAATDDGTRVSSPTSAESHVNRAATPGFGGTGTGTGGSDRAGVGDPASSRADHEDTDDSPYTQPISASELRRRADDDD